MVLKQEFADQVLPVPGGGVTVTPEFWLSHIWRVTMGQKVLAVSGDRTGAVRVYAHSGAGEPRAVWDWYLVSQQ